MVAEHPEQKEKLLSAQGIVQNLHILAVAQFRLHKENQEILKFFKMLLKYKTSLEKQSGNGEDLARLSGGSKKTMSTIHDLSGTVNKDVTGHGSLKI